MGTMKPRGVARTFAASLCTAGSGGTTVDVVAMEVLIDAVAAAADDDDDDVAARLAPPDEHAVKRTNASATAVARLTIP